MTSAEKAKEQYFEWQPHDDPDFAPLICGKGTIGGKGRLYPSCVACGFGGFHLPAGFV